MQDETKRHEIARKEMEQLLAEYIQEAMLSARQIAQIREQLDNLTGTVEEQIEQLQNLRKELETK